MSSDNSNVLLKTDQDKCRVKILRYPVLCIWIIGQRTAEPPMISSSYSLYVMLIALTPIFSDPVPWSVSGNLYFPADYFKVKGSIPFLFSL